VAKRAASLGAATAATHSFALSADDVVVTRSSEFTDGLGLNLFRGSDAHAARESCGFGLRAFGMTIASARPTTLKGYVSVFFFSRYRARC